MICTYHRLNGEILGRKIKEDPLLKDTVLFIFIPVGKRGSTGRLQEIGFAPYLTKPVKFMELYNCFLNIEKEKNIQDNKENIFQENCPLISVPGKDKLRILVVEDNQINQKVALRMLKKFGYRADAVGNGKEAIDALKMLPYDMVLMDLQMPEMDGS